MGCVEPRRGGGDLESGAGRLSQNNHDFLRSARPSNGIRSHVFSRAEIRVGVSGNQVAPGYNNLWIMAKKGSVNAVRYRIRFVGIGIIFVFFTIGSAFAATEIAKQAEIRSKPETVDAIRAVFNRAEAALKTEDVSAIMMIYSDKYQNRGLRKEDTARIWADILNRYDRLSSHHLFSRIIVDPEGKKATVTCTGAIRGDSALIQSGAVQIDTWFEANHYLVLEEGVWRMIGHDPFAKAENLFGAAIHLLF